jgi:predicted N-acetyltransferase YhbS
MPLGFEKVAYNALQFPGPTDPGRILIAPLMEGAHDLIGGEIRWRAD